MPGDSLFHAKTQELVTLMAITSAAMASSAMPGTRRYHSQRREIGRAHV